MSLHELKAYTKALLPYIASVLLLGAIRVAVFGIVSYAQSGSSPLHCPSPETVTSMLNAISTIVLLAVIAIVILVIVFNTFGFVSMVAMRIGEFFNERLRFIFELILIYVLFLWNLNVAIGSNGTGTQTGCAQVDWNKLLSEGPIFFQILGWLLQILGMWQPSSS